MPIDDISLPKPAFELAANHPRWPRCISDLPDAPSSICVAGELPLGRQAVAIVGTRAADAEAVAFTRQLAAALAGAGVTIVSGGAYGIDAAAHEGALDVGGKTIAVLATGLRRAYPPMHGRLFSAIARSGALVSESDRYGRALPWAFLRRNRLIAALASAVVVVQAPAKSGALSTATWAKRLKRRLFAVPAAAWDPRGAGCITLLREGARICTSAADVLSLRPSGAAQVALPGLGTASEPNDDEGLPESSAQVLAELGARARHPDELSERLDMQAAQVHEALLNLVLAGLARQQADGTYTRIRN